MVKALDVLEINGMHYFIDERLNELRRVDNPHDFKSYPSAEALAEVVAEGKRLPSQRPFRVVIQSADFFRVDVIARTPEEAEDLALNIDPDYLTAMESCGTYDVDEVREIPSEDFSPPDAPESVWVA